MFRFKVKQNIKGETTKIYTTNNNLLEYQFDRYKPINIFHKVTNNYYIYIYINDTSLMKLIKQH